MMTVISKSPRAGKFTARAFQVPHHYSPTKVPLDYSPTKVPLENGRGRDGHC
jgi:hypothetical protein